MVIFLSLHDIARLWWSWPSSSTVAFLHLMTTWETVRPCRFGLGSRSCPMGCWENFPTSSCHWTDLILWAEWGERKEVEAGPSLASNRSSEVKKSSSLILFPPNSCLLTKSRLLNGVDIKSPVQFLGTISVWHPWCLPLLCNTDYKINLTFDFESW